MKSIQKKSYLAPFIVLFITTSTILTIISISISYYKVMKIHQEMDKTNIEKEVNLKIQEFNKVFKNYKELLKTISNSYTFKEYINEKKEKKYLEDIIFSITKSNSNIMQLRFIDEYGKEKFKIQRNKSNPSNVYETKDDDLQNKKDRYYFKESINKNQGEFYISKLDLNIENKEIEIPLNPVIRIATPIFDKQNYKKGILIINIFMENSLNTLVNSKEFNTYIFDQDYSCLFTNNEIYKNFENYLSDENSHELQYKKLNKKLLLKSNEEELYLALEQKEVINLTNHIYTILIEILFIIIPISLVLAFILSRIPRNLLKKIEEDHKIILHQSKQNAVSEMIIMIAHQWRQPLTVISLISQEIIFSHKLDMLDKKTAQELGNQLLEKIDLLSKSIDDFRNFFRKDDVCVDFDILQSILEIKKIMSSNLIKAEININIKDESQLQINEAFKIHSFKTKFSQIMLNLLTNSIHAIEENCNYNEKREINISLIRKLNLIEISILDSRKGIKEDNISKIFDLYYSSDKQILQGKGLGLYFVKNMIETKFNGSINVKNEKDGAKFTITIPC